MYINNSFKSYFLLKIAMVLFLLQRCLLFISTAVFHVGISENIGILEGLQNARIAN